MKSLWKDFLYFSSQERIACICLVLVLAIFIGVYALTSGLMTISVNQFSEQETIKKEFEEYTLAFKSKEVVGENESLEEVPDEDFEIETAKIWSKKSRSIQKLTNSQTININSSSEETFRKLPGVGESTAKKIVDYRNQLGGFSNLEQLMEIQGISRKKFTKLLPYLQISNKYKIISFYKTDEKVLESHPYINESQFALLLKLKNNRELKQIDDLLDYPQFKQSDIDRLKPYLNFDD